MPRTVKKKILPEYFEAVLKERKTFEIRKDEDGFSPGDIIRLEEWDGEYTGRHVTRKVTYVLRNAGQYGLKDGYCVIGMQDTAWTEPNYTQYTGEERGEYINRETAMDAITFPYTKGKDRVAYDRCLDILK